MMGANSKNNNSVWRQFTAVALLGLLARPADGLEFDMQTQTKCFYEELNEKVLVVVDFWAYQKSDDARPMIVAVQIEDPHAHVLYDRTSVSSGQYAFTTKVSGEYRVCFFAKDAVSAHDTKLRFEWKSGVAATDWGSVAKKEHLDEMTVELKQLSEQLQEVYNDLQVLRKKEEEMRDLNEATNERVAWFSIASLAVCITSGIWQLWYLKKFFMKRKIL